MNLLPVIYASLLIFGSLFLIVLVTSYITYKVKQYSSGVALASTNTRTIKNTRKVLHDNREKVNVINRNLQAQTKILKKRRPIDSNQRSSVTESQNQYKSANSNEIVNRAAQIKAPGKSSQFTRMTRIQDLRSSNNHYKPKNEIYFNPVKENPKVSNTSILRYYEDF